MSVLGWVSAAITLIACVVVGAIVLGGIGFIAGFYGPLIFAPDASQGPMLGIFFTGPLGVLVGAVLGAICWHRYYWKSRKQT